MAYQVNQSIIDQAKKEYADAQARGDKAGMDAAHAKAEAERAKAGYSGGADGSQYISIGSGATSAGSSLTGNVSSGQSGGGYTQGQINDWTQQMQQNSQEWHTADAQRRAYLEAENKRLGALVGGRFDPNTGKWGGAGGNDLYDYSSIVSNTNTTQPSQKAYTMTTYYDKQGNPYTGYIIDNKTYKDPYGNERIEAGMLVPSGDGKAWYEMTDNGGIETNAPAWAAMLDPQYQYMQQQIAALQQLLTQQQNPALEGYIDDMQAAIAEIRNFMPTEAMTYEEAMARATAQAGGQYDKNLVDLINAYNQSAVSRGMFGQTPTEALKMEAMAANELSRAMGLNDLAGNIRTDDFNEKQLLDQNYLNRLQTEIGLTQDLYNTEMQAWQMEQENRLNAVNMYLQQQAEAYNKAVEKLNMVGYATSDVAQVLGIPEGTLSTDERVAQAEFDRQKELMAYEQQLNKEMASYNASLNAKYSGGSGGGGGGGGGQGSTPEAEPQMKADAAYKHALDYFQQRYQDTGEGYTQEDVDAYAYQLMWGTFGFDGLEALNEVPGTAMPSGPKNTIGLGGNYIRDYYTNNYSPRSTGSTGYGDDAGYLGSHGKSGIADEDKNAAKDARNDEYIQNLIKNGGLSQAEINNYYNLKR